MFVITYIVLNTLYRRVAPQAFQSVKLARFFLKNVYDNVEKVDQDPFPHIISFDLIGMLSFCFETLDYRIGQGANMHIGGSRADDKVIDKVGCLAQINGNKVFGFAR